MFDFPLTVTSIDDVPEKYRSFYEEDGDEFKLDDGLSSKITKLVDSLDKERKRAKDAVKDAKAWADLGKAPDDVKQQIEDLKAAHDEEINNLKKLIDEGGDASAKFDKIKAELVKAHKDELATRDQVVAEMEGTLKEHLMEAAAKTAIAEAKGKVKPLLPYVMQKLRFEKQDGKYRVNVIDDDGDERLTKDGKPMDIRALVDELKQDDDFSALFDGSGTSGSNARPTKGGQTPGVSKNPFAADSLNLTEQMRLKRDNPALADKLAGQAG